MGQNSPIPPDSNTNTTSYPINNRFRFKRNPNPSTNPIHVSKSFSSDRRRSHGHGFRSVGQRKLFSVRVCYMCIFIGFFSFVLVSMVLQSSIGGLFGGGVGVGRRRSVELDFGSSLRFVAKVGSGREVGVERTKPRVGVRSPRLAIILGNMRNDPSSLMLLTVMKNLRGLGYMLQIYATEDGETKPLWEKIVGHVFVLDPENYGHIDWSRFDVVVANSLAAHYAISSLMQEPFCSVQLIWIIQEDTLANRLLLYEEMEWEHIITYWKNAFKRADVVVYPEFSFPMLYSVLDTGNFFVIPGSPVDVWAAEKYQKSHSKSQLRIKNGFGEDEVVVLVVGSSFFYNELSWDYAVSMHNLGPLADQICQERRCWASI